MPLWVSCGGRQYPPRKHHREVAVLYVAQFLIWNFAMGTLENSLNVELTLYF